MGNQCFRPNTPEMNLATREQISQTAEAYAQHFRGGFSVVQEPGFHGANLCFLRLPKQAKTSIKPYISTENMVFGIYFCLCIEMDCGALFGDLFQD
jgi:hypothetical protein